MRDSSGGCLQLGGNDIIWWWCMLACLLAPVFATVKILMKVPGKYSNRQRHLLLLLLTLTSFLPKFSNQPKASLFFRVNFLCGEKILNLVVATTRHHHHWDLITHLLGFCVVTAMWRSWEKLKPNCMKLGQTFGDAGDVLLFICCSLIPTLWDLTGK